MATISEQLASDLKDALRAGEKDRVEVIRGARAALQNAQLEAAKQRYDEAVLAIATAHADDAEAREAALAAISVDGHAPLTPETELAVIGRTIKRRHDAAELYRKGGRPELAAQEEAEAAVLQVYLPQMLGVAELRPAVAALIAELELSGPVTMGKLMPILLERYKGRAEGRVLSQVARELLSSS